MTFWRHLHMSEPVFYVPAHAAGTCTKTLKGPMHLSIYHPLYKWDRGRDREHTRIAEEVFKTSCNLDNPWRRHELPFLDQVFFGRGPRLAYYAKCCESPQLYGNPLHPLPPNKSGCCEHWHRQLSHPGRVAAQDNA